MFQEKYEAFLKSIGEHQIMCLATSADNRVTARSMSIVIISGAFYFQTDSAFLKYQQISENPHVALCVGNIQIEGLCQEKGHPLAPENTAFASLYRQYYESSYEQYSPLAVEVLFAITPTKITIWLYENNIPYREFYDCTSQTYQKIACDILPKLS